MSFFGNIDFNKLTYTEKTIYNYLENSVDKIPYLHVRDIALEAHAGTSSVMRLIHKMGYDSYSDFKNYVKKPKSIKTSQAVFPTLSAEDFPENFESKLEEVAYKIIECDNLIFTGIGSSGLICDYAARRFAGIGINTFSFSDVTYPIVAKLRNTADNIVIALSISGETSEVSEVLHHLHASKSSKDITFVGITPNPSSSIAQLCDTVLSYHIVKERRINLHYDLTSQIPAVFLLERLSEICYELSK